MTVVTRLVTAAVLAAALTASARPAVAQFLPAAPPVPAAQTTPADPLGRGTPRGTITEFVISARRGDIVTASECLQMTAAQRRDAANLVRALDVVLDRYLVGVMQVSDSPAGSVDDRLPPDRERIGTYQIGGASVSIDLVRVTDATAGPIWLVSSGTLADMPEAAASLQASWIDRVMPRRLVDTRLLGWSLAQWIVWAGSFVLPLAAFWLLMRLALLVARRAVARAPRLRMFESWHKATSWPLITALTLFTHLMLLFWAGFPLQFRIVYNRVILALGIGASMWLLWTVVAFGFEVGARVAQARGRPGTSSLMRLGERVAKVLLFVVALLVVLKVVGVDTTTALAGVGLGGVAIAFGAQKSVENLLGGVFLLSDGALAVGDNCTIANRTGIVEDVTLRSVRLRTDEQTLLSVPAGVLAQSSVENLSSRRKMLIRTLVRLQYGTTTAQLRAVLDAVRARLEQHPSIENGTSRIRLVDFGLRAIELELFAYVLTTDGNAFLAIREELLLDVTTIVEASGTAFAQPTQFAYLDRDVTSPERPEPRVVS